MNLNPVLAVLGLSGGEIILIMISLMVMTAIPVAVIVLVVWLMKRNRPAAATPPVIPPQTKRICSQCRAEVAPDAPQGLCPQCLARAAFETQAAGAPEQRTSALPISEIAKFFPQLEIVELLGHGGMGMVYKARQPQLDRFVALKILSPELSRDPAFAERFAREARALARLNHPNIVAVYESGKSGDFYYLLMEYVDGLNLSQMQAAKKPLAPKEAFAIVPKICEALQYAHDEGIVHRDIKPANILIDKKGRVKIADFGLAKIAGQEIKGLGLTQTRAMMGTPQYMAPEQLEKPLEVDHRADIYSLGVVFYEMLTGELPLGRFPVPSKKVQLDVRLDEIVLRTLEKEPELRYQQAGQIKSDVETVVSTPGTQSAPNVSPKPAAEPTPWWAQPKQIPDWEKWGKIAPGSKLSLLAIIAVICAGCTVAASLSNLRGPIVWVLALVTTVLGWISVAQIRHSNGKLRGLGLAVFAGLVFPLLLLDFSIVMLPLRFVLVDFPSPPAGAVSATRVGYPYWVLGLIVVAGGLAIALDWLIASAVWRAVKTPTGAPKNASSQHKTSLWGPIMAVGVIVVIGLAFAVYVFLPRAVHTTQYQAASGPDSSVFAKVHLSVFEIDNATIDKLIPSSERTVSNALWQVATPTPSKFKAVVNAMSRPPGPLADHRATINSYPRQPFSVNYTKSTPTAAFGSVSGWIGIRNVGGQLNIRIEQFVSRPFRVGSPQTVNIVYEDPVPSCGKLLILIPEIDVNGNAYMSVLAYEIDQIQSLSLTPSIVAIGRPDQSPYQWWNAQGQSVTAKDEWLAQSATAALAVVVDRHKIDGMLDVEIKTAGSYRHGGANDSGAGISDVDGVDGPHMRYSSAIASGTGIGDGCTLEYLTDDSGGGLRKYLDSGGRVDVVAIYGVVKWQEVTKIQEDGMIKTNGGYFRFGKVTEMGPTAITFDCVYDFDPDYEISIVGVDKKGKWYRSGDSFGSGHYSGRENRRFFGSIQLAKSNLSNFLILKRPVTKTAFENIPTKP